jgi:hypothetical protein
VTIIAAAVLWACLSACSVGQGSGEVSGRYVDTLCGIDTPIDYDLDPTFFSADVIEDGGDPVDETRRRLTIRIQRGSYSEAYSDGIWIDVADANAIARGATGVPIPISTAPDALVRMTLYMGETCVSGFPDYRWSVPAILEATSGAITFRAIYAPDVDPTQTEIAFEFTDATFTDRRRPATERSGTMSGNASFFHQRGRPAQTFP